ncbi:MAG: LUD domain-containing protein [Bradyrhizobium sp.]
MVLPEPRRQTMSSRDVILASIRANLPKLERPLPAVPKFDDNPPPDLIEAFGNSLTRMGGRIVALDPADGPPASIRVLLERSRLVCSSTSEIESDLDLATVVRPRELADVDHAVVRATCGVAETGSVLLTDRDLKVNALAYLAQHLIVLLDPADIVVNMHSAYARPEFREYRYAVFHTGPSATADIEGILIQGAQGVRSLSVLLVPRTATGHAEADS